MPEKQWAEYVKSLEWRQKTDSNDDVVLVLLLLTFCEIANRQV